MAKDKTAEVVEEIKADDEKAAEIAEVREDAPEIELSDDVAKTEVKDDEAETEEQAEAAEAVKLAKAGKHSAKALREAEEEAARLAAKELHVENEDETPKVRQRQQPNPLHQHGKKYRKAAELVDRNLFYSLDDALDLAQKTATTKFDSSVELHINLGVDPRQADQMVRSSVVLPHGTGKTIRVAVFADGEAADKAKAAGADLVGTDELIAAIEKGKTDFDMLISTPAGMATLGKVAKILGPRGLMPNPKSGTVTPDPAKAVKEAKAGKVEFRIDKQAILHQVIGKASFKPEQLRENATAFLSAVMKAKPSSAKGTYVKAMSATTSMGPGIKVDAAATISAVSTGKR
ncbi:MAG: rplA [Patescibacteria group bacterium]|nr:rplA [Patescibacteria group bacterium]